MNSILKKIRQSDAFNKENRVSRIKAVILMSLFTFTFLEAEFLFVDMISCTVSGDKSVSAQNYALGASVVGFALYPLYSRLCKKALQSVISIGAAVLSVVCLFLICRHSTYAFTLCMGLVLFLILGLFGSAVFYKSLCLLEDNTYIARLAGLSYMLGTLLQIANNNLIHIDIIDVKAKLESYKTPVKDKYIAIIDDYIAKFDTTFKTTGAFSKAETRQQAAQIRALKLVKSIAPTGCTYDDVDKAIKALDDTLPKLGIDKTLATDATDYIQAQEDKLNTVDGVVLPDRENAALAKKELEEIQNIMFKVAPPQNEPLLSYERNLLEIEDKLSQLRTPVKDKYIGIIKKHLVDFDEKFRKVSLIKTAATREEAAKERALKFVKSKTYNTVTDVNNARNELAELLPELGITSEQATEANEYLTNTENKLNGTAPQSKLKGVFGMFKK